MRDREGSGYTYMLTLTAPGTKDHRRWVQGSQHRGKRVNCGCHTHGLGQGRWNAQEAKCWNRLRLALSRVTEGNLTFIGAVETQGRGALHRHVVVHVDRPLIAEEVQELALVAGYGCVYDLQLATSAGQVSRYISKYVTKSAGDRPDVPWLREVVDRRTGELVMSRKATYRTWSSAQTWGHTMKGLREVMAAQARARARHLEVLAEVLAGDGSPEVVGSPAASTSDPARGPD